MAKNWVPSLPEGFESFPVEAQGVALFMLKSMYGVSHPLYLKVKEIIQERADRGEPAAIGILVVEGGRE